MLCYCLRHTVGRDRTIRFHINEVAPKLWCLKRIGLPTYRISGSQNGGGKLLRGENNHAVRDTQFGIGDPTSRRAIVPPPELGPHHPAMAVQDGFYVKGPLSWSLALSGGEACGLCERLSSARGIFTCSRS